MRQEFNHEQYLQVVTFNKNDPTDALHDNASYLAYYGAQEAVWSERVALTKLALSTKEAEIELELRADGDKITAPVAAAKVAINSEVKSLKKSLVVASGQHALYKGAIEAFKDRGNNARSLNTTLRSERYNTTAGHSTQSEETVSYNREERRELAKRLASNS